MVRKIGPSESVLLLLFTSVASFVPAIRGPCCPLSARGVNAQLRHVRRWGGSLDDDTNTAGPDESDNSDVDWEAAFSKKVADEGGSLGVGVKSTFSQISRESQENVVGTLDTLFPKKNGGGGSGGGGGQKGGLLSADDWTKTLYALGAVVVLAFFSALFTGGESADGGSRYGSEDEFLRERMPLSVQQLTDQREREEQRSIPVGLDISAL